MLSYVNNDARASEDRTWVRANVLSSSKVNGNIVARQRHISRVEVSENFQATREGISETYGNNGVGVAPTGNFATSKMYVRFQPKWRTDYEQTTLGAASASFKNNDVDFEWFPDDEEWEYFDPNTWLPRTIQQGRAARITVQTGPLSADGTYSALTGMVLQSSIDDEISCECQHTAHVSMSVSAP